MCLVMSICPKKININGCVLVGSIGRCILLGRGSYEPSPVRWPCPKQIYQPLNREECEINTERAMLGSVLSNKNNEHSSIS